MTDSDEKKPTLNRREFAATLAGAGALLAAGSAQAGPATSNMRSNYAFNKGETPVILEVAINGGTTKKINPAAPETAAELAEEAIKCLDAGATIVHAHSDKPSENVYLGGIYQPTLGVQIMFGFHRGRVTTLQDGFAIGDTLSAGATEAPTRRAWEDSTFVGVVFDANVFQRLFGGGGAGGGGS